MELSNHFFLKVRIITELEKVKENPLSCQICIFNSI